MKILVKFNDITIKPQLISPFLKTQNCQVDDEKLVIPGVVKMQFTNEDIKCFCIGIEVAEKILSNVCTIDVSEDKNVGSIKFPNSLQSIICETESYNFEQLMDLVSNGITSYINTSEKKLRARVELSQWLDAFLNVEFPYTIIEIVPKNYSLSVNDQSAQKFCERVKERPLSAAVMLRAHFDFGFSEYYKPQTEYVTFWKTLKSNTGYKKYSNLINDINNISSISFEDNKKYVCKFDDGKIEFFVDTIGDKYPKKATIQFNTIKNIEILQNFCKYLSVNDIDLMARVSSLRLEAKILLKEMGFMKDDEFFIFSNIRDGFLAKYDIGNESMLIKQTINVNQVSTENINSLIIEMKKWINNVVKYAK